jgi:hypothetical protein
MSSQQAGTVEVKGANPEKRLVDADWLCFVRKAAPLES